MTEWRRSLSSAFWKTLVFCKFFVFVFSHTESMATSSICKRLTICTGANGPILSRKLARRASQLCQVHFLHCAARLCAIYHYPLALLILLIHVPSNPWPLLNFDKLPTTDSYAPFSAWIDDCLLPVPYLYSACRGEKASSLQHQPWKWEHGGDLFLISGSGASHYEPSSRESYTGNEVMKLLL